MQPKVFIIILNYNGWEDTRECINSLEKLSYKNFEVIIVDNGSKQKIRITTKRFKTIQFFNKENLGFAGGNNVGIKYALQNNADYILLLNNDTKVISEFLRKLVEIGENNSNFGILGSLIFKFGSNKIHFGGGKINWLYTKATHKQNLKLKVKNLKFIETDYITGAGMLIKKQVIDKIGLMPEKYFLYFEDVDWCIQAQKENYKCILVPESRIYHKVSASTKQGSFSYIYYHTRNGFLLAKRNAPGLLKTLAYLSSFLIFIKQVIKLVLFPSKKKWAKATMLGIRDFYKGKFGCLNK